MRAILKTLTLLACAGSMLAPLSALAAASAEMKASAQADVEKNARLIQQMVDQVFSYAEPGFQEYRTSAYLTGILEKNGFKVTRGVAGMPTAWTATWGDGGPMIALGSDIDDLRGLSQYPGIAKPTAMVDGAPGHGEGHNSGMPMQIAAALAAKSVMEKNHLKGRIMLWPGVAEELLGSKAFYVRDGVFKDVDACIFAHVGNGFGTSWGPSNSTGLVSVEYTFKGRTSHAAAAPWDGKSALDGVELMDIAWNMKREHLHVSQRSHYIITNGGDQPNIVPGEASVWYFFREHDFASVRELYDTGNTISEAAAMATGTTVTHRLVGEAAPSYGNKPLAELAYANIKAVGMPKWSDDDQKFARSVQEANKLKVEPLRSEVDELRPPRTGESTGGASDDIGDITWNVPTITVRYPSNIPSSQAHNIIAAMTMATPIAHKGAVAGAKAIAMTVLDLVTTPESVSAAKDFFNNVQTRDQKYVSMLSAQDVPDIHRNDELMTKMRPSMEKFYFNSAKYGTYLDQLGINYPDGTTKAPLPPSKPTGPAMVN